jgi:hypothetical protein
VLKKIHNVKCARIYFFFFITFCRLVFLTRSSRYRLVAIINERWKWCFSCPFSSRTKEKEKSVGKHHCKRNTFFINDFIELISVLFQDFCFFLIKNKKFVWCFILLLCSMFFSLHQFIIMDFLDTDKLLIKRTNIK